MKKVLVFGFEKFSNYPENPSEIIIENIKKEKIKGITIQTKILPVTYEGIEEIIVEEIKKIRPDLVLGTGLAPGRFKVTIEKIAINYRFSDIPDNKGNLEKGEKIDKNEKDGIFATIDVEKIVDFLNSKGIPSEISLSAGGYICNESMFIIMRETRKLGVKGGFVHFPCHYKLASSTNLKCPSMDLETMKNALKLIVMHELNEIS